MNKQKIILAGASGFLGKTLAAWFEPRDWEVVVLSRNSATNGKVRRATWDGVHLGAWAEELEEAAAVINLAGRSVNCRYHARNRRAIVDSRVQSTRVLGEALRRCSTPPPIWLNSSTATIYKHTYGEPHDEHGLIAATREAKDAFSIEVAQAWEQACTEVVLPRTRKVLLRTAMVFGNEPGGVYRTLRRLTRLGLGGKMGHGRQFVSWIHGDDFCAAIEWLINRPDTEGVYNLAAPHPVTNRKMMATLRKVLRRPIGLPASRWMLEVGAFLLRTETELMIKSRCVVPARLLAEGFRFCYSELRPAVDVLEGHLCADRRALQPMA